jgi:glucose-1-phosphate thymidylyltransferase
MYNKFNGREFVGLVPAAGSARRLNPIPCSKEVLPIGHQQNGASLNFKVACQYLLEKLRASGINKVYLVIKKGKWDILSCLGDGSREELHIAYLVTDLNAGVPYTLDLAYPFIMNKCVAFGFPDIIFDAEYVFETLRDRLMASSADIVLGLFPADQPRHVDIVSIGPNHEVREIYIKPVKTDLRLTWGTAVWTPAFTDYMHSYIANRETSYDPSVQGASNAAAEELFVGDVVRSAIQDGLKVDGIQVSTQPFLDIGIPENLVKAMKKYMD